MSTPTYHLYLDDSGTRYPDRAAAMRRDGMDCFAIGGLLIKSESVDQAKAMHNEFLAKQKLVAPLHSNSIRAAKGQFKWIKEDRDKAENFFTDLESLLCSLPGHAVGCIAHRPGYNARYAKRYGEKRWDLCKSAYTIVVERAAKFAALNDRRLMVYIEASGKKEDRAIKEYHAHLRGDGMYFSNETSEKYEPMPSQLFERILFKEPSFVTKDHPLAQFSDLLLYPLIKGRYDPTYRPYVKLLESKRIIDCVLAEKDVPKLGVKYYCFDEASA